MGDTGVIGSERRSDGGSPYPPLRARTESLDHHRVGDRADRLRADLRLNPGKRPLFYIKRRQNLHCSVNLTILDRGPL